VGRVLLLALVIAALVPCVALADDGDPRFHRTTPRASLEGVGSALVIGVPGGRAWGIESELRPLPAEETVLFVRLVVSDEAVREAFVRVAYYGSATERTRQLAVTDSEPVEGGARALVAVALDPPPGAVAYRVRVLARLTDPTARSSDDAVTAVLRMGRGAARPLGSLFSRLLP
jgi:hypothetical protein